MWSECECEHVYEWNIDNKFTFSLEQLVLRFSSLPPVSDCMFHAKQSLILELKHGR